MPVEFRLLRGLELRVDGQPVGAGFARQRAVLVALLADLGRPVSADELADRVWGERLPRRPREALYGYVSRLRGILAPAGDVAIDRQPGGYVLTADPLTVDLHRFEHDLAVARGCGETGRALELFTAALDAWRGEPMAVVDTPWMCALRDRLRQLRRAAELDRHDLALRLGHHAGLVPALAAQADRDPLDERAAGQLMLALYRGGRRSEALAHYQDVRLRLADELGTDPGGPLRQLHRQILAAAHELDVPAEARPASPRVTPRQLPAAPAAFVGRARELAALDRPGSTAVTWVLSGGGGVGKTGLALRWAYEHLSEFPDGQLFVNLRGFDPAADVVPAEAALHGFLTALGVPSATIPADVDARAALYRSLVADRRMLVVLDNARDTPQVTPLLPGGSAGTVLITSRHRMGGLLATHGARALPLDVLAAEEARELLVRHVGETRVAADPRAADELLEHCAGLPLALRIVAARAATRPDFPLATFSAELRVPAERLDALDTGELPWNLRTVFSASTRVLDPGAATAFRLLGLAPGPDIALPAVAALTGLPLAAARSALTVLETASLVEQHRPGRYRMHDLTRLYATELAHTPTTEAERRDAPARLFDHYCYVASVAAERFSPGERHRRPPIPSPTGPAVVLPDVHAALAWLDAERENLVAAARHAAALGQAKAVTHLSTTLYRYLDNGSHYRDALALHTAARDAAAPGSVNQAHALCSRGFALIRLGRPDEALRDLRRALDHSHGDPLVDYAANTNLGFIHDDRGDRETALAHFTRALDASRLLAGRSTYGIALNNLGDCYRKLGRHDDAIAHLRSSIAIAEELKSAGLGGVTLTSLADLHRAQGDHDDAHDCYTRALELAQLAGDRGLEVEILNRMAAADPDPHRALERFRQVLGLAREIGLPLEQAHAHHGIARLQHVLGDRVASRNHANRALDIYTELKSHHARAVEELLGRLLSDRPGAVRGGGERPPRGSAAGTHRG
ncbi:BTAD domain-containing putative transcriptional regulator [Amycolatopsis sp. MEPSY49]|uniref:AfsR/SARP family transcriptional regulator n=1 Tax=Amycolatopsis sp. MEPSY49 TaxID=3151600 RepID=UPI003EF1576A